MLSQLDDAIAQADWLATESGHESVDDLWRSDPDLFTALAQEWRDDHPLNQLGGG